MQAQMRQKIDERISRHSTSQEVTRKNMEKEKSQEESSGQ